MGRSLPATQGAPLTPRCASRQNRRISQAADPSTDYKARTQHAGTSPALRTRPAPVTGSITSRLRSSCRRPDQGREPSRLARRVDWANRINYGPLEQQRSLRPRRRDGRTRRPKTAPARPSRTLAPCRGTRGTPPSGWRSGTTLVGTGTGGTRRCREWTHRAVGRDRPGSGPAGKTRLPGATSFRSSQFPPELTC